MAIPPTVIMTTKNANDCASASNSADNDAKPPLKITCHNINPAATNRTIVAKTNSYHLGE